MEYRMVFAGFGGQGVLLAGQLITEAGMKQGKNVSWMPSYGPEMRGGVANCSVVISDEQIGAPIILEPDLLVAMNKPSLDKLENKVISGGYIIYNSSLIDKAPKRNDVNIIALPCNDIANELNLSKVVNMPIIGAIMAITKLFKKEDIISIMYDKFGKNKTKIIETNIKAIEEGEKYALKSGVIG